MYACTWEPVRQRDLTFLASASFFICAFLESPALPSSFAFAWASRSCSFFLALAAFSAFAFAFASYIQMCSCMRALVLCEEPCLLLVPGGH